MFGNRSECYQAWNTLLSHVVDIMSEAFYETKKQLSVNNGNNVCGEQDRLPPSIIEQNAEILHDLRKLSATSTTSEQHIVVTMMDDEEEIVPISKMTSSMSTY